ncbi:Thioredoxin family protein [Tritrichomonas foetus]|uniref:protein disulfide-isomerase n=1 Tax=Tritrichomonas foetus TaxID=1144522 RepID=A0A1J4K7D3_9EUKA|nr:Thioredoxin family protein [Tritrichomonas foetus]|eukprot:OHT06792.1 Thioredoxin family protein [Tritrichomonas foetus]
MKKCILSETRIIFRLKKMIIHLIFTVLALKYVEIEEVNEIDQFLGKGRPVFAKFHKTGCPNCILMEEEFSRAASFFDNVSFIGINCMDVTPLCDRFEIRSYPSLYLFHPFNTVNYTEFQGDRSADGFSDFIEKETKIIGKRPPRILSELNPFTFDSFIHDNVCTFITYYAHWCKHCKKFLPEIHKSSIAFQYETNAKLAIVNCGLYDELCKRLEIKNYPTAIIYRNSSHQNSDLQEIEFNDERNSKSIINFVNEQCGTNRQFDGMLNDKAGLVSEAALIVKEFIEGENRINSINNMKKIDGTEFYIKVMNRILQHGFEQVKKDMDIMKNLISNKKGKMTTIDEMKKRYNVFAQFLIIDENTSEKTEL